MELTKNLPRLHLLMQAKQDFIEEYKSSPSRVRVSPSFWADLWDSSGEAGKARTFAIAHCFGMDVEPNGSLNENEFILA